uniref:LemA family protein n=1 Tax=candidate division WOR-3 bacterium TaxID=2052148 RepID=A0A7C4YEV2_UNCW3
MIGLIILVIVIFFIFWIIGTYNGLVRLRNMFQNAWSDIDVQLKRRYDLIPNIVETVKEYAKHEKEVFDNVTKARANATAAITPEDKGKAENQLTGALRQLFAVAENYPELKANVNFLELQKTLSEIEDAIQNSRRYYNAVVRDYNIRVETFPAKIVAMIFNFQKQGFFEIEEGERSVPKVDFK